VDGDRRLHGVVPTRRLVLSARDKPVADLMVRQVGGIGGGAPGAAVLGLAMPFLPRLSRLEPRMAAGPVALGGADVMTILLYLNLARWLLA
jgi:Mg/Co/Ni transporter MgtE